MKYHRVPLKSTANNLTGEFIGKGVRPQFFIQIVNLNLKEDAKWR